ncbi:MAG: sigma-70 family RNA polymerase sigma factor [Balneolaceae bacterium]|nr:MAG: sigma-70 family RNA polymerase sigma factor [Balneolaceae bacterium]
MNTATNQTRKSRVDYSSLVSYLQMQKTRKANELLEEVIPKLVDYLKVTMGADENTAKECVQQAFLNVYERILDDKIRDPKTILSYFMQTSRNELLNLQASRKRYSNYEIPEEGMIEPAEQIDRLVDEERAQALKVCLTQLDDESRVFISYFLNNPGVSSKQASVQFDMTEGNVRTKKSRITKQLHNMYRDMMSE